MRLPRGYRSVVAAFDEAEPARQAARELRRRGFEQVQVDRVSLYPDDAGPGRRQPLSGRVQSLASLTLGADIDEPDTGAALAADPAASGLASGPAAERWPYVVTALVQQDRLEEVCAILRRHGGRV